MCDAAPVIHIGLDLAWSSRNPSGGAVLRDGHLVAWRADLRGNDDVVAFVGAWLGEGCAAVIAIDAPLCVPNERGARPCDMAVTRAWGRYKAGVHPANRRLVAYDAGVVRGEKLVDLLGERFGFAQVLPVVPAPGARIVCEVYPHAAHVSLFGLDERIRYKAKRGWDYPMRWAAFAQYQTLLRGLAHADPPLWADDLVTIDPSGKRGKQLKALEDALDALTCAYIAAYLWRHGAAGQTVYGTVTDGHILVPRALAQAGLPADDAADEPVDDSMDDSVDDSVDDSA